MLSASGDIADYASGHFNSISFHWYRLTSQKRASRLKKSIHMNRALEDLIDIASGQWILKNLKANGGHVVVLRALWTTLVFSIVAMGLVALLDPGRKGPITLASIHRQFWDISGIVVVFLGASYLALYARFVSQWQYLAGLYNQIKQAEAAKDMDEQAIAEWKAGYLEDAENLHLAAKNNLAPVLRAWTKNPLVEKAFVENTPGGVARFKRLAKTAQTAYEEAEAKWK